MGTLKFITKPTKTDLSQTKAWLKQEHYECGESFICNWSIIEKCFDDSRFICIRNGKRVEAFFTWSRGNHITTALVAAVRHDIRGQGLGSNFIKSVFDYLSKEKGILVIELECAPSTSETFWRKHGFIDYPPGHKMANHMGKYLYKSLLDDPPQIESAVSKAHFELWRKQPFEVNNIVPDLELDFALDSTGAFMQRIAIPAKPDWKARVTTPGAPPREDKVKYLFSRACLEGEFIVGIPSLA